MLLEDKFIQNNFSFIFPRNIGIRKMANEIEEILSEYYMPPQITGIPDDMDPNLPRIIFTSKNNHSRIILSQLNVLVDVNYDDNFTLDDKKKYLEERISLAKKIIDKLGAKVNFIGLNTIVNIQTSTFEDSINVLLKKYYKTREESEIYEDLIIKKTLIFENKYYANISVQNYKTWNNIVPSFDLMRLSKTNANEFGVQLFIDYNDRYAFNEKEGYFSDLSNISNIIDESFEIAIKEIDFIRKEG